MIVLCSLNCVLQDTAVERCCRSQPSTVSYVKNVISLDRLYIYMHDIDTDMIRASKSVRSYELRFMVVIAGSKKRNFLAPCNDFLIATSGLCSREKFFNSF